MNRDLWLKILKNWPIFSKKWQCKKQFPSSTPIFQAVILAPAANHPTSKQTKTCFHSIDDQMSRLCGPSITELQTQSFCYGKVQNLPDTQAGFWGILQSKKTTVNQANFGRISDLCIFCHSFDEWLDFRFFSSVPQFLEKGNEFFCINGSSVYHNSSDIIASPIIS